MTTFQQAPIEVQKVAEFQQLKAALQRVFAAAAVEQFLKRLQSKNIQARQFEQILAAGLIDRCDRELQGSGSSAKQLYGALTVSDQGLMREFYLTEVENVDVSLREKYSKVFRYS